MLASVLDLRAELVHLTKQVAVHRPRSGRARRSQPALSSEHVPSGDVLFQLIPAGKMPSSVARTPEGVDELRASSETLTQRLRDSVKLTAEAMRSSLREQIKCAITAEAAANAHNLASALAALERVRAYPVTPSDAFWHIALEGSVRLKGEQAKEWGQALFDAIEGVLQPMREALVADIKRRLDEALSL